MADFGEDTQWLKGTLAGTSTVVYVNVGALNYIRKENENDYIVCVGGAVYNVLDCTMLNNLEEIQPA